MKEKLFFFSFLFHTLVRKQQTNQPNNSFTLLPILYVLFFCVLFSSRSGIGDELIDIDVINTIWKLKSMKISYMFSYIQDIEVNSITKISRVVSDS